MNYNQLKKDYKGLEILVLILMVISLPLFGFVYLYYNSGNLNFDLPELPDFVNGLLIGLAIGLLIGQYVIFHRKLKLSFEYEELFDKAQIYIQATRQRFYFLFLISILSTIGLLFYENATYVVIFALTLIFYSLAKPTPDRIKRLLKLNKEQAEIVRQASRPE
nr:hypothetical protein [Algoriphagus sp.]